MDYKEEYEKLHKNILAALQQRVSEGKITEEIARSICADFAKESEDERIRKSIIDLVEKQMPKSENKKWMIAWLKNQGEQKPAWSEEDYDEIEVIACHLNNIGNEAMANSLLCIRDKYNNVKPKQKYEWSEEDEEMYIQICNDIDYLSRFTDRCDINLFHKKINWLESLKERVQPQPKQELSEEDEKEVAVLEAYIRSRDWSDRHIDRALSIVDELVKKLKSLSHRNTWKPSDAQMQALEKVRVILHNPHIWDESNPILYQYEELMRDLMKLREK